VPSDTTDVARPFWRDPIVVIGTAVPTLILLGFFAYLYREYSTREFLFTVYGLKTEADALAKSGKARRAFDEYEQILTMIEDRGSSDVMVLKYADATKRIRDRLYPSVKDELDREEMARRAQAEAERLAAEAERLDVEAQAEAVRLSKFTANVAGGSWIINKLGQSDILRGLHVNLIRASVQRKEVADLLKRAKDRAILERAAYETILRSARGGQTVVEGVDEAEAVRIIQFKRAAEKAVEEVNSLADHRLIDTKRIYDLCRSTAFGMGGVDRVRGEDLWPKTASRCKVRETVSNIEGKYKFEDITGGKYYIYAMHSSEYFVVEWLIPVLINGSGDISCDLHNERATLILNKSD